MGLFGRKKKKQQQMRSQPPKKESHEKIDPTPEPVLPVPKAEEVKEAQVEEPEPMEEVEENVLPEPEETVEAEPEEVSEPTPTINEGEDLTSDQIRENILADLMSLKGVGRKRAEKLMEAGFTSATEVAEATLEELASVEGFSNKLAQAVKIDLGEEAFEEDVEADSAMDAHVESEVVAAPGQETGSEDDISARLLQWSVDGYDISELERVPKDQRNEQFQTLYESTGNAIIEMENIRREIEDMNILGLEEDVDALTDILVHPSKIEVIRTQFSALKEKAAARNVRHELQPLQEVESLANQVSGVLAKLDAGEPVESLIKEVADIKQAYKEDFFLSQMAEQLDKAPPMEVKKAPVLRKVLDAPEAKKKPMEVEDLFLLHHPSYRLINHLTNREVGEQEKQEVFTELKAVRSFVRHNDKFKADELNIIKFGDKIALIQQGKNTLLTMVVKGDVNVWSKKLIGKVLAMIEKEEGDVIATWDGDATRLPGAKKNMTALMYACVRLGKQAPKDQ